MFLLFISWGCHAWLSVVLKVRLWNAVFIISSMCSGINSACILTTHILSTVSSVFQGLITSRENIVFYEYFYTCTPLFFVGNLPTTCIIQWTPIILLSDIIFGLKRGLIQPNGVSAIMVSVHESITEQQWYKQLFSKNRLGEVYKSMPSLHADITNRCIAFTRNK